MKQDRQHSDETADGRACTVQVVLFDFGGVLAEEGFRNGLMAIARDNGRDPESFTRAAFELIFNTGYVLGRATEAAFWDALRRETGIDGADDALRAVILERFKIRPGMIGLVKRLNDHGVRTAVLSDQTDWLEELDRRHEFFRHFERVFNSYHLGTSKQDPGLFDDVVARMGAAPEEVLFTDDHPGNVERARERGLIAVLFTDEAQFRKDLDGYCPGIVLE